MGSRFHQPLKVHQRYSKISKRRLTDFPMQVSRFSLFKRLTMAKSGLARLIKLKYSQLNWALNIGPSLPQLLVPPVSNGDHFLKVMICWLLPKRVPLINSPTMASDSSQRFLLPPGIGWN